MSERPALHRGDWQIQVDIHDGLAFLCPITLPPPAGPGPVSVSCWVHIGFAQVGRWPCDLGKTPFLGGVPCEKVEVDGQPSIKLAHDIGFLIPHVWIPFFNSGIAGTVNVLVPQTIALSGSKVALGAGDVIIDDDVMGVGPAPVITCSDLIPLPTGVYLCHPRTVTAEVKFSDFMNFLKMWAIDVALALVTAGAVHCLGKAFSGAAKKAGRRVSEFKGGFKAAKANNRGFMSAVRRGFKSQGMDEAEEKALKKAMKEENEKALGKMSKAERSPSGRGSTIGRRPRRAR